MSKCPQCQAVLDESQLKTGRCPACGAALVAPEDPSKTISDSAGPLHDSTVGGDFLDRTLDVGFIAAPDSAPAAPRQPAASPPEPSDSTNDSTSSIAAGGSAGAGPQTSAKGQAVSASDAVASDASANLDPGTVEDQGLAQTYDPGSLAGAPVEKETGTVDDNRFAQTIDPGQMPPPPPAPAEPGTWQDRTFAQTLDPGVMERSPPMPKTGTIDDRGFAQTYDPGGIAPIDAEHMTAMWSSANEPGLKPEMTLKGQSSGGAENAETMLSVQPRSFRQAGEKATAPADYHLLEVIGEGGMGVVYAARQASIDRTVAIKMVKANAATDMDQRAKFLSEAVVTGDLDHPNIVPIYDLGTNDSGALFYSMKRVRGTPWLKEIRKKSLVENVEILMKTADAVAFAHSRGVIHRDLKPENVMLGDFGEVLVMDWGLALSTPEFSKAGKIARPTGMGGTPAYMAPEMATGPVEKVSRAADIYLLGAILFDIITGKPPHTGKNIMDCVFGAARNAIQPTEQSGELLDVALKAMATLPSDRYESVRAFQGAIRDYQSHSESIVLSTRAEQDLAKAEESGDYQIFSRALFGFQEAVSLWDGNSKARASLKVAKLTYAKSALSKGDYDLGASLLDPSDPEHAELHREITAAQRERDARQQRLKTVKRMVVGLVAVIFVVISAAFVQIRKDRDRALTAETEARDSEKKAKRSELLAKESEQKEKASAILARAAETQAKESEKKAKDSAILAKNSERAARDSAKVARDQRDKAQKAEQQARVAEQQAKASEQIAVAAEKQAREDRDRARLAKEAEEYQAYIARIGLAAAKIDENAFDRAVQLLNECKPSLRNWEWGRLMHLCGQSVHTFQAEGPVDSVAFSPDASRFVTGSWDGMARVWNVEGGDIAATIPYGGLYVHSVAFSPNGQFVATGGSDKKGYVKLWNASSGELVRTYKGHEDSVLSVVFSRDGARLLTSSYDKTARLWDVASGRQLSVYRGHNWWVWAAVFSPDEKRIVTTSQDGTAIVWDAAKKDQTELPLFNGHSGPVYAAAFSPDGKRVVTAGYDKRVLIWEPDDVKPFDFQKLFSEESVAPAKYRALEGHGAPVRAVRFSPDGKLVLSGSQDNTVNIWDAASGKLVKTLRGHAGWVRSCAFSRDGHWVLSGSHDHQAKIWSISGYEEVRVLQGRVLEGHADAVLAASFSPDGQQIVTASRDRTARTWDIADGKQLHKFEEGHEFLASSATFFPDGKKLLTAAVDNTVRIWDVSTGGQVAQLDATGRSAAMALSHDAKLILTGGDDNTARLWDAETGKLLKPLEGHLVEVTAVAFSPDDAVLYTGDASGRGKLWDANSGRELYRLDGHTRKINAAAFTEDGKRILTASADNTVGQWVVETGKELVPAVIKHPDSVLSLDLSPEGRQAITSCADGRVRVWDIDRLEVLRTLDDPSGSINSVDISPDGRKALTASIKDRTVRLWDLATGRQIGKAQDRQETAAFLSLAKVGGVIWSATFSPENDSVLTVGGNGARMWDVETGLEKMNFSPHGAVASASFSPDGERIVTGSWDNSARIWNARTGQAELKLANEHKGYVNSALFSPDGKLVLTASDDKSAKLWDSKSGKVLRTFVGHKDRVRSAAFSKDGARVLTASNDKTARIWDVKTGKELLSLAGHEWAVLCAAFTADGVSVITGSEDNSARIWDARSGEELFQLQGHTAPITSVAFSPDGLRALTGSRDNLSKLWDAQTGEEILNLKSHSQEVTSVAFSPDGQHVLTGSRDGTAIVWLAEDWKQAAQAQPDAEQEEEQEMAAPPEDPAVTQDSDANHRGRDTAAVEGG